MRYTQINKCECCNGNDVGTSIFTSGCFQKCPGCFNSKTWSLTSGQKWTKESEQTLLALLDKQYIKRLSILGGEPLIQNNIHDLSRLCREVKLLYPDKKIWLWSGYLWEDICNLAFEDSTTLAEQEIWDRYDKKALQTILFNTDILVDGPFIQEQKDITLKWRGSKNQRVIDVPVTLRQKASPQPVLYCD